MPPYVIGNGDTGNWRNRNLLKQGETYEMPVSLPEQEVHHFSWLFLTSLCCAEQYAYRSDTACTAAWMQH